jgi:hypothetical protein
MSDRYRLWLAAAAVVSLGVAACGSTALPTGDGAGGDTGIDAAAGDCTGLSNAECAARSDCELIPGCPVCGGGDPGMRCIPAGAHVEPCSLQPCPAPGMCRSVQDCSGAENCLLPGQSAGCGACDPSPATCASDTDCAPGDLCQPIACSCDGNGTECVPGCTTDSQCGADQMCGSNGRCEARMCNTDSDCPAQFRCAGDPGGCLRLTCSADVDCTPGGFCVNLTCQDALGSCAAPPP